MELGTCDLLLSCVLLAACCLLASGCGVQGEPLPPLLDVPVPAEVQAVQRGSRALVIWTAPALTTEGQAARAEKLGPAEVYRAVLPGLRAEVARQEFEAAAQRVASLPVLQGEYSEEFPPDRTGNTVAYAVRLLNRRGDSAGFSNIAVVPALAAPAAPAEVRLKATERAILLEWSAVAGAAAYHLYRGESGNPLELAVRTEQPRHADENFQFGHEYRYVVRAVAVQGAFRAESGDSPAVSLRAEDVFPPGVPANLTAVPGAAARVAPGAAATAVPVAAPFVVDLSWDPNPEADLAGYNLYRGENGGTPRRLNGELLVSPAFRDEAVKPAVNYSYAVSAVDQKGNESARSEAVLVRLSNEKP